jgi:ABC-2 type transport system permease protein
MIAVFRAERRKLLAQLSTRMLALVCALGPLLFGAVLSGQSGVPADTLLGSWVHSSGYVVSLVVLGFAGYLGFPVLAGALAGDMFSSEDRYGTWKTILTRSRGRREVFFGKLLAATAMALALLVLAALSSIVAGVLFTGDQPLVGLGGQVISSGESVWLLLAAWALSALPLLGFVSLALLFSIASRNGIVGVLGPLLAGIAMQLLALVGKGSWMHAALLASAFDAWHGLLSAPRFYAPLLIGVGVAIVWIAACLWASWWLLGRRDFAGTVRAQRPAWVVPARVVAGAATVILLLGLAGAIGPAAVTAGRLEASIEPVFNRLTLLQQRELGRSTATGAAKLNLRTSCRRHSSQSDGPGDDWTCTMTVFAPRPGVEPFQLTPVTYDVSVKSNGCYKAEAPPAFVGQQTITDASGHNVENPLFTIYGCFDTTGTAPRCAGTTRCATRSRPPVQSRGKTQQLHEAEQQLRESEGGHAQPPLSSGVERETEESQRVLEKEGATGPRH